MTDSPHSGHGDHQEVDTVPVAQTLTVGEVGRVSGIFKLKDNLFLKVGLKLRALTYLLNNSQVGLIMQKIKRISFSIILARII